MSRLKFKYAKVENMLFKLRPRANSRVGKEVGNEGFLVAD